MTEGFVLMECKTPEDDQTAKQLRNIEGVKDCRKVTGAFDLVVQVKAGSQKELVTLVSSKLREVKGVKSTVTLKEIER